MLLFYFILFSPNIYEFFFFFFFFFFLKKKKSQRYEGIFDRIKKPLSSTEFEKESPFLNFKSKQLAEQICLLNHEYFRNIDGIEFLNQIWKKGEGDELECPNLLYFIDRFNRVLFLLFLFSFFFFFKKIKFSYL